MVPRMEILAEPSVSPTPNFRQTSVLNTSFCFKYSSPNSFNEYQTEWRRTKKKANRVDIITDILDENVMETEKIDGPISNNLEIEADIDLDPVEIETNKKLATAMTATTI